MRSYSEYVANSKYAFLILKFVFLTNTTYGVVEALSLTKAYLTFARASWIAIYSESPISGLFRFTQIKRCFYELSISKETLFWKNNDIIREH